jgi:NADH-quinone oxidoreductase subunit H
MATTLPEPQSRRFPIPLWGVGLAIVGILIIGLVLLILNWSAVFNAGDSVLRFIFEPNTRVGASQVRQCYSAEGLGCPIVHSVLYSLIFFFVTVTGFAYTTLLERKWIAFFQQRVGPNRVGPGGFLQPAADAVKLIFKEDITPSGADWFVYMLAPILKVVPSLILLAVVPIGPNITVPWFDGNWYNVPLGLADPNVGVLWLLAVTSLGTYGVVLAGWASNNKYAMLGGLRASAQMLSYELSLGLCMAVPILIVGSMSLGDIIRQQTYFYEWFVFQNPLAAGILFIALLAELSRTPFDLPEAEQELTQGYMTEYSGMKFASFMMAEYLGMIGVSAVVATLYFGGYQDGFGLVNSLPILGPMVLIGKVVLFLIFMIWIRATVPRIRYDRLMQLGWKVLLPLSMVAVLWSAIAVLIADAFQSSLVYGVIAGVVFVLVVGGGYWLLRRSGADIQEVPFEEDPIITGERSGIGWTILQAIGALLAVPFALYGATLKWLDNLAAAADRPDTPAQPPATTSAITTTEASGDNA